MAGWVNGPWGALRNVGMRRGVHAGPARGEGGTRRAKIRAIVGAGPGGPGSPERGFGQITHHTPIPRPTRMSWYVAGVLRESIMSIPSQYLIAPSASF